MKKKIIYSVFAGLLLTTVGCSEDFLKTEPTNFVTADQLAEAFEYNEDLLEGTVNGIYTMMFDDGTGGTTGHDDFGQKGYDIMGDMLSGDMALSNSVYGWYSRLVNLQVTINQADTGNYQPWRYYYRIVRAANRVIEALGGNDIVPEGEAQQAFMGQAKALRAYGYFYLSQYFSREYEPSREILPIYIENTFIAEPKSTTAEVYELMIADLNEAIELLEGYDRGTNKHHINQDVAKGLLAYVYASQNTPESNQLAKDLTDEIIASGYPLTTAAQAAFPGAGSGFNDVTTPSWMWGVDLTTDQGLGLISWWGQVDYYTYSYASAGDRKSMDSNLFALIPANDVRKNQFPANFLHMPTNKFFAPGRQPGGQGAIETDLVYMRIDEFYLLNAEMAAKIGDEPAARTRLTALLSNRIPNTSYVNSLSGQALLNEIYLQTRIELWGEGKTYLAMKRNQKTITRGSNHVFQPGVTIPYNDERLTFKIPLQELQDNPFISSQNY